MTLGVRAIVENADGHVLFVRHTYTSGLHFPGGGVEHGETVLVSLARELEEEGGVALTGGADLIGMFSNHRVFRNDHVVLYRVRAGDWTAVGDPIGREISQIVWADPAAPPKDATEGTRRRLSELYGDEPASAYW